MHALQVVATLISPLPDKKTQNETLVVSFAQYPNAEALETVIKMGRSEGLTTAHNQLEEVLKKL